MRELLDNLTEGKVICINNIEYIIKTKTWYSIQEDKTARYIKCELSNNKVLVIIPDDNLIYVGEIIKDMKYEKMSEDQIKYNGDIFNKTGEGHQYIVNIDFGNESEVEGQCTFEDYESQNNIISLGILTDKNIRADVYADIINMEDIKVM